ncbi:hypothetical protein [Mumia sp. DW29H23]|uniref:hypothetical protein n=1 Tax=Mumia sp. DW29H23 TaxID=3421241 RepID=UPI003D6947CC
MQAAVIELYPSRAERAQYTANPAHKVVGRLDLSPEVGIAFPIDRGLVRDRIRDRRAAVDYLESLAAATAQAIAHITGEDVCVYARHAGADRIDTEVTR